VLKSMLSQQSPNNGCLMIFGDEANSVMAGFGVTPDDKVCFIHAPNPGLLTRNSQPNSSKEAASFRSYLSGKVADETFKTEGWLSIPWHTCHRSVRPTCKQ